MANEFDWLLDPNYKKNREAAIAKTPGLQQAADAASMVDMYVPNTYFDSETGQSYQYGGGEYISVPDSDKRDAYIDKALQDPTKWVASNLNWGGLGHGGNFSALDDQIKYLKDNKYDTSTLDKSAFNQYNLTKTILAQGTTGRWTGQGFGGPVENAKQMARQLNSAGIEDIKDFGQFKKQRYQNNIQVRQEMQADSGDGMPTPTGKYYFDDEYGSRNYIDPKYVKPVQNYDGEYGSYYTTYVADNVPTSTDTVWGNKKNQQAISDDYGGSGNFFSGTFAGHGRTNYGVQFAADGTPYFYTQFGGDTSSMGDIAPILSVLSVIPSPLQPFAAAANAIIAIDSGNTLGGLAALAGIPGVSEAVGAAGFASIASGIQTANKVVNLVNAIESGNVVGAITAGASLTGANVGSTQIGDTGYTVSDAMKAANLVKAISSEDPNAIFNAATSFAKTPNIQKSLNNTSTTLDVDGQKIADVDVKEFVAELKNPDSPNFLGDADKKLDEVAIQPGTQLASTDNETALQAIEDLRAKGAFKSEAPRSVEEMVSEIPAEEGDGVTVIPGENDTQLVIDGKGNVVDMIPATEPSVEPNVTEPSVELKQVDPSRKEIPTLTDKPAQDIVGEPIQNPSEELRRMQDILTNAGSNLTVDENGLLKEVSEPEVKTEPTGEAEPEEKKEFQGPMGPFKEDTANRYKEEFAKYLDYLQAGSPPPPEYEPPPFNEPGPYWDEFNQNLKTMMDEGRLPSQWQVDEEGNYTYVSDDGSTLTLGSNGEIVNHTEAPAGNLPGETPVQEPAKQPATQPATQPGAQPATQPAATGPNLDWGQLFKNAAGVGAVAIGAKAVGDLLTDDNDQVQPQVQAPRNKLKMDWNQADIQAPVNGIAYGQQYFNPVFTEVTAAEGGLMSLAGGGMLGSYSDGGRLLRGPGDGMSDNIPASISGKQPARLADGEFVIPADVVSHLGNGSTEAGSRVLYKMMERIRKARTGNPKQGKQINPSKFMPK